MTYRLISPDLCAALRALDLPTGKIDPLDIGPALFYLPETLLARLPALVVEMIGDGAGSAADEAELVAAGKAAAIAAIAAQRWQRCLTFTYDGVTAYADPAIAPLSAKILALDNADSDDPVNFKLTATEWRSWTRTQLRAYGEAIDTHIQGQFDNEKALTDAIGAAADRETLAAIDLTAGWP